MNDFVNFTVWNKLQNDTSYSFLLRDNNEINSSFKIGSACFTTKMLQHVHQGPNEIKSFLFINSLDFMASNMQPAVLQCGLPNNLQVIRSSNELVENGSYEDLNTDDMKEFSDDEIHIKVTNHSK